MPNAPLRKNAARRWRNGNCCSRRGPSSTRWRAWPATSTAAAPHWKRRACRQRKPSPQKRNWRRPCSWRRRPCWPVKRRSAMRRPCSIKPRRSTPALRRNCPRMARHGRPRRPPIRPTRRRAARCRHCSSASTPRWRSRKRAANGWHRTSSGWHWRKRGSCGINCLPRPGKRPRKPMRPTPAWPNRRSRCARPLTPRRRRKRRWPAPLPRWPCAMRSGARRQPPCKPSMARRCRNSAASWRRTRAS